MTEVSDDVPYFVIDATKYREELLATYRSVIADFTPMTIFQFAVVLPFQVPFPDHTCLNFEESAEVASTLYFTTLVVPESVPDASIGGNLVPSSGARSRVEMLYVTSDDIVWQPGLVPGPYFDVLVRRLNVVISAYILTTKDDWVYRVSTEMFQPVSIWRLVKIRPRGSAEDLVDEWGASGLFLSPIHMNVPHERERVSQDTLGKIVQYSVALEHNWNPFVSSEELWVNARGHASRGRYREAVLDSQTSVETFLNAVFEQLLIGEGKTPEEAISTRESTAFMTIVKKGFHPRLGGVWDVERQMSKVGTWYEDTYLLRDRVTHAGYFPSAEETNRALDAAQELRLYVHSLIQGKKSKYPALYGYLA